MTPQKNEKTKFAKMQRIEHQEEVIFAKDSVVKLQRDDMESLKLRAIANKRRRMRFCAHHDITERIHEMFHVHEKGTYIRPHKHINKIESFHIVEGLADIILFDEEGGISEVITMSDFLTGYVFYYRIPDNFYHSLIIRSDFLVVHETTNGPFLMADTIFAPYAPEESKIVKQIEFMEELNALVIDILSEKDKKKL